MRKKLKNFIRGNRKEILIIIVFIIIALLVHNLLIDSYSCGRTRLGASRDIAQNTCLVIGYVGQSIFAGSLLISIVLLYRALKK